MLFFLPEYLSFFSLTAAPTERSMGMNKSVALQVRRPLWGKRFNFSNFTHKKVVRRCRRRSIAANRRVIRVRRASEPEPVAFVEKRSDAVIFIWLLPFGPNQGKIEAA